VSSLDISCPACRQPVKNEPFYCCEGQPTNSVILCKSPEEATSLNHGNITLVHCNGCGFIFNSSYDPQLCIYDQKYEEPQTYSGVFNSFNHALASHLIDTYRLRNKAILEIGSGKGDFLNLVCRMENNRGIGYDPSYVPDRSQSAASENVIFYTDFFPEQYDEIQPDCIICKMTLEHIPDVHHFLGRVRKAIVPPNKPIVFFQVPDSKSILKESRFWDIYYEHCSYFTMESLDNLFHQCGFQVVSIVSGYDHQYLMVEALPIDTSTNARTQHTHHSAQLVASFTTTAKRNVKRWQELFEEYHAKNKKVALWGGGSKAVAFLSTLGQPSAVHWVVDINPHKQGSYIPGNGCPVVAPEELVSMQPDIILVMNPIYMEEIKKDLRGLHLDCTLIPVIENR
jgi:Methyltransferase domain/C-methyltransferase C-terminal domain